MFTDYRRVVAGVTLLLLSACSGEGDIRSPDLPRPFLISIGPVQCEGIGLPPAPVPAGFTSTCRVTECRIGVFSLEDGEVVARETTGSCPPLSFTSSAPDVATITDDGGFVAVAEGTTDIVASGEGLSSPPTTVTVTPACVASFAIQGPTSVVAGIPQPYDTTVTLSTGQVFPSTADTEWTPSGDVLPSFNNPERPNELNSDPLATEAVVVNIGATYTGEVAACDGTALTAALDGVSITPANLLPQPDGLCVDLDNGEVFQGCRADTGACEALSLDLLLTEPATSTQLVARARFDNGLECNVTEQTVFTPAETPDIIEVSNGEGGGSVTPLAVGDTTIAATFRDREAEVEVAVRAAQVLGANSVAVSSAPLTTRDSAQTFDCVGSFDLIAGLDDMDEVVGRLDLFAGAALCDISALDENGNCTASEDPTADPPSEPTAEGFNSTAQLTDVTNARQVIVIDEDTEQLIDIDWQAQQGYWDGNACITDGESPAIVGNLFAPDYPVRSRGENGVVQTSSALGVGFACVTASYTNPLDPDDVGTGGMTVLALPITVDSALGDAPSDDDLRLCQAIAPLFTAPVLGVLAGSPLDPLAQAELTPVLSALTEVVNGLLVGAEPAGTALQIALEGLDPVTRTLVMEGLGDFILTLEGTVYDPLLCGVQTLLGAITGGDVTCDAL